TLQPGQELRLDVKRRCERTTGRACILATVGAQGIQATSAEACVRISEPPRLNLSIAELSDPVSIGQTTGYVLSISNTGTTVARDLRLEISIPTQMVFQGEGQRNPTRARERQGVIVFDPLAELQPGASARYEISLRAAQEVRAALVEASLFLNGQAEAVLTASERTEIVRPR
ncbi:MAG TPA: hypothetical protein VGE52_15340, partial [Pirellulales bacterium]